MLQVEERFMIKDLYRRGISISEIARITGHDRKTVRTLLHEPLQPPHRECKARPRKLDPFAPYLEKRIAEGVLNASKLFGELQAQGYQGGKSLVKDFVQPWREARRRQATVRFETEPGEQAQVDWGHFGLIQHHGHQRRLYAFIMTLGWSRAMYLEFTIAADAAWFLRGHLHAFQYFNGAPHQVLHDNLKSAVLSRDADGTIHWNPRYLDFAYYYGFTPRACQPYRAQTKGKVESGIRYVRGNFWPGLRFVDLADLNQQARHWLDTVANVRVHGTTGEIPCARLPLEGLQSLFGKPDYDTSLITYRRSTRDCLVSYDGNYYSVPAEYARQLLTVKECESGELIVLNAQGNEIAHHRLVSGYNQRIFVPAHYQDLHPHTRPLKSAVAAQVQPAEPITSLPPAPEVETRPLRWYEQLLEVVA
jgi:transposase